MKSRTRLTTDQKLRALALIARGDTLSQVAAYMLNEFDVTISESALSQTKKAHADTIEKMRDTMAEGQAADAEALLKRSRRMINAQLDKAERDSQDLSEVERKWRDGEIQDYKQYRREKAGLLKLSIAELATVSKTMHAQTIKMPALPPGAGPPALPAGSQSPNPAQLESLLQAIQQGNTVEIQRLIFNPGGRSDQPVSVPQ